MIDLFPDLLHELSMQRLASDSPNALFRRQSKCL